MKSQLKEAHEGERQALVAKMEAGHSSEVSGLKAQYEAELLNVKEELSRVRREGEAERTSTEQRLASETVMKQVKKGTPCFKTCSVEALFREVLGSVLLCSNAHLVFSLNPHVKCTLSLSAWCFVQDLQSELEKLKTSVLTSQQNVSGRPGIHVVCVHMHHSLYVWLTL